MPKHSGSLEKNDRVRVPRVAFLFAVLVIGVLLSILSENLTIGPSWAVLFIVLVMFIPMTISNIRGRHDWSRIIALCITGVVTVGLISSVSFLIYALFAHTASAAALFRDAGLLWVTNIAVFAVWYWETDRGGPMKRHLGIDEAPDFCFPQMISEVPGWKEWLPSFLDYLFLAFNTSTAFSPTDTMILSRKAKTLMMLQSCISLLIVAVLAARAINIA